MVALVTDMHVERWYPFVSFPKACLFVPERTSRRDLEDPYTAHSVSAIHRSVGMSAKIETVLGSLTREEKVSLLAGKDFWETVPIPDKGVPAIKVSGASREISFALTLCRPVMDPTVREVRSLLGEHEQHASRLLCARLHRGTRSSLTG